jgi:signal transduction histidine kinase
VNLVVNDESVSLTVADNGIGFNRPGAPASPAGLGLTGMRERIESLGGSVKIHRHDGAKVVATVPRPPQLVMPRGRDSRAA